MEDQSLSDIVSEKWIEDLNKMKISSHTMNKLVMDYLVREGYKEVIKYLLFLLFYNKFLLPLLVSIFNMMLQRVIYLSIFLLVLK